MNAQNVGLRKHEFISLRILGFDESFGYWDEKERFGTDLRLWKIADDDSIFFDTIGIGAPLPVMEDFSKAVGAHKTRSISVTVTSLYGVADVDEEDDISRKNQSFRFEKATTRLISRQRDWLENVVYESGNTGQKFRKSGIVSFTRHGGASRARSKEVAL